jgi:hypothetical protein
LFHGIQATLFAQQMAARQQLERMRHELPQGAEPGEARPGTCVSGPGGDRVTPMELTVIPCDDRSHYTEHAAQRGRRNVA